jgi:Mechanosensitive ion channel, conserved TM helix
MGEQQTVGEVFGPFHEMWVRIVAYLPSLAAGLLILALGFVVCWLAQRVTARVVLWMRLDRAFRDFRWARGLELADARAALARIAGNVVALLLSFVFLQNAFVVWGLDVLGSLIGRLVFYLPHLVVGSLVMVIGSLAVAVVSNRVRAGLTVEGFERAGLVGRLTRWALMVVVTAFALEELGIAPHTVQAAVKIGLGTLGVIAALAVGLGSKDAVAAMWASILDKPRANSDGKMP